MSDEEYSSEEEPRQGRGRRQAVRGPHYMSLSSNEEVENVSAPSSPVHDHSNDKEGEADPADEVAAKDVARPQLSKETVKMAMKGAKRVDEIAPNMVLNQTILDHYHNARVDDRDQGPLLGTISPPRRQLAAAG